MTRDTKERLAVAIGLLAVLALFGGLMLQARWDRECGGRWDSEVWSCR